MPELPEVEAVRRDLEPAMQGARFERVLLRRSNLRIPFPRNFAGRLQGHSMRALTRTVARSYSLVDTAGRFSAVANSAGRRSSAARTTSASMPRTCKSSRGMVSLATS